MTHAQGILNHVVRVLVLQVLVGVYGRHWTQLRCAQKEFENIVQRYQDYRVLPLVAQGARADPCPNQGGKGQEEVATLRAGK